MVPWKQKEIMLIFCNIWYMSKIHGILLQIKVPLLAMKWKFQELMSFKYHLVIPGGKLTYLPQFFTMISGYFKCQQGKLEI